MSNLSRIDRLAAGFKSVEVNTFEENAGSSRELSSLPGFLMGSPSKSGQVVNYGTALKVTTVLACCRVLAEGIAQVPCKVIRPRRGGKGSDPATDHPLYRMLGLQPNAWSTAFEFWETCILHLALVGNFYALKLRGMDDKIAGLYPLEPRQVQVTRRPDMSLSYRVEFDGGQVITASQREIWHVKAMGWNSWMGLEVVKLAREAIGLSLAVEEAHSRLHENGVQSSGSWTLPEKLSSKEREELLAWLMKQTAGASKHAPMVIDSGATWLQQQMSGVDAQHVETRRLQVEETCRFMRVMPIMVGATDAKTPAAGAEQNFLAHVVHTISPLARRLEQSATVHLLNDPADQRDQLEVKFYLQGLMRGDYKSRQEGLLIQRRAGIISANDWRALEDMNPRDDEGGDQFLVEANMTPQDGPDGFVQPSQAQLDSKPSPPIGDPKKLPAA